MVSMTATAVKIEKIIEPLPTTESTAARIQKEKELSEKAKLEAERKQQLEAERKEKLARGEIFEIDKSELFAHLKQMESVAEMLDEVKSAMAQDPTMLSEDQYKKLEECKEIARIYGKRAGAQSFIKQAERYFFS